VTRLPGVLVAALGHATLLLATGCPKPVAPGDPIAGLTREQRERFDRGRVAFETSFVPETGLGPLFNADSCGECHEQPVAGGPGDERELHVAAFDPGTGFCDPLVDRGGPVIQQAVTPALKAALGIDREPLPDGAAIAERSSPDVLGFGLLDSVPESTILSLADPDDRNGDGISGRPNRFFDGRVGRFGRKALVPTLREFNEGAFPIEQGVTTPGVPTEESIGGRAVPAGVDPVPEPEIDGEVVDLVDAFVRMSAPPAPDRLTSRAQRGRKLFSRVACDACHVPTLRTGDSPIEALENKSVTAYTDLLLHDMGPELADICLGLALPSEFRTEPLMGLRLSDSFMHDGRAKTVEEAILLHGGEASRSRAAFDRLSEADRRAVLEFLASL